MSGRLVVVAISVLACACDSQSDLTSPCETHANCPSGYTCDPGRRLCVLEAKCQVDGDCCPGLVCFNGGCRRLDECLRDIDCLADDAVCNYGVCVAKGCTEDSQCKGLKNACIAGRCVSYPLCGGCSGGRVCELATDRCIKVAGDCAEMSCSPGQVAVVHRVETLWGFGCNPGSAECRCVLAQASTPPAPGPWLNLVGVSEDALSVVSHDMRHGYVVVQRVVENALELPTIIAKGSDVAATEFKGKIAALARDQTRDVLRFMIGGQGYDLDDSAGSGYGSDLTVGPQGGLHASYYTLQSDGWAVLQYAHVGPQSAAGSQGEWTRVKVTSGPVAAAVALPCGGKCALPEVCILQGSAATCAIADILDRCDPRCPRSEICFEGQCLPLLRRSAGLRPWRDGPGGDTAIAVGPANVYVAYHDHRQGTVGLATSTSSGAFETTVLSGGNGGDVGHHLALDVNANGVAALAYHDALRGRLILLYGSNASTLGPGLEEAGGVGTDLVVRPDGKVVIAHGLTDGTGVRILWGTPGVWVVFSPPYGGHVGRFNSVWLGAHRALVATLEDRLNERLEPTPHIAIIPLELD